ncbi:FMN reductase (NADPH) [Seinonella peptonophila]|uniref:FMN reductase (NADPH) n=1 Tax=Seinonella peptonophila TaxID=112248 RepID=A0A1M4TCV1_9BACL|nr:oxygen-insensitive NADPH nitroreductase [Seinonella peptonophila]SHE42263.1 FMN reductase (NADPH) [Seinonella peptonophila]
MLNRVIETILEHRSIRRYEDRQLSDQQIRIIIQAAQAASTSSNIQAYSIIGVKDHTRKKKLAELAGNQPYVEKNGHLLIFCADLYRHQQIGKQKAIDISTSLESTEKFMVALIDASIAAQNAAIAAESMGLGICYIGGLRNQLKEVTEILQTPDYVIPLFGMTLGYPLHQSSQKPRLPIEHIYHEEVYQLDQKIFQEKMQEYDQIIQDYYRKRTNGKRMDTWTAQIANMLAHPKRLFMNEFVRKLGFNRK